jgi:hypothetical protein
MVIVHAANDMTGSPADAVIEVATVRTVRFYAITALFLGVALAAFMVWALKADEESL